MRKLEKISRAERCRNLRYKRPALMELGYFSIMGGLEEIMECSAEIHWAFDDDETLINAFDGNEEEAYEFRWAFTDLEAEAADVLCFYGAGADLWRDDTGGRHQTQHDEQLPRKSMPAGRRKSAKACRLFRRINRLSSRTGRV